MKQVIRTTLDSQATIDGLDNAQVSLVKNALTLINPKFETLHRLGKNTRWTERTLKFYRETSEGMVVPRGAVEEIMNRIRDVEADLETVDNRTDAPVDMMPFCGSLREDQKAAVQDILLDDEGTLEASTGSGKTVIALAVIAERKQRTLIIVHTKELLQQWIDRIETFLDIPPQKVGVLGCGKFKIGDLVTVAMIQTARKMTHRLEGKFGHVIVDECHRCPSATYTEALRHIPAKYTLGLTATPYRRDGLSRLIRFFCGPVRHKIDKSTLVENGHVVKAEVYFRLTRFDTCLDPSTEYSRMLSELTKDEERNALICDDIAALKSAGGIKLVLSDRREHCLSLTWHLEDAHGLNVGVLTGQTTPTERDRVRDGLREGSINTLIATSQLIGEGFDLPEIATVFLATPMRFKGRVIQCIGRALRPAPGKNCAVIYDYLDQFVGVLISSARARENAYREQGLIIREGLTALDMDDDRDFWPRKNVS